MEIDNLSVSLKTNGADDAIKRIQQMADAVDKLAKGVSMVDSSRLEEFANGLASIKRSAPTSNQATNMVNFANAISTFATAISGVNISQFANDLSNVASTSGARVASSWGKATSTMQSYTQSAQQAATATNNIAQNAGNLVPQGSASNGLALANGFKQANAELSKVAISANSIGGILMKIGAFVPTKQFKSLGEQAEKVKGKYEELRNTIAKGLESGSITEGSSELEKKANELAALRNEYDRLIQKQRELALAGSGVKLNPTLQAGLNGFKSGFSQVTSIVKGGFVGAIRGANRHLTSLTRNMFKASNASKAILGTGKNLTQFAKKLSNELLRVSKMLKLMVTRMALRAVIKEVGNGFKSLALHSEEFNKSMSSVINGSKKLGYSFAAMISPLINALAPAIVYVINLLTQLINVINQVFSALTGHATWNRSKDFTESWADNIKAANKGAKELKKTVLGFDELNQLQEKTSGGGGNDITDMFETVEIDPKWKEFANWLKDMWKNKDFYDLGELVGTKLKKFLDSIPWEEIRKTSNDLGKAVATLINGLVEVEGLGNSIGKTVAQGVNTVFEFINGFVHNLHWDSIGKFIADTFNGFFENIDWDLIKDTVVTGLRGLADSINSFTDEFHWDNISNFIIKGIDTVTSGVLTFFKRVSWKTIGQKLGEQLQKTIKGIDWKDVGRAIGSILQAALDFVASFINELNVDDIVKALKDLVNGFFDEVDTKQLGQTLAKLINLAIDVAVGFWKENKGRLKEEGSKLLKGFFEEIDTADLAKVIGAVLTVAVLGGIASMSAAVIKNVAVTGFSTMLTKALFGGAGGTAGGVAGGEAAAAGSAFGVSLAGAITGGLALGLGASHVLKDWLFDLTVKLGANEEKVENLKKAYDGFGGTLDIFKEGLQETWYKITGNEDALKKLNDKTITLKDSTGEVTKVVDRYGDTIIDFSGKIDTISRSTEEYGKAAIKVHDDVSESINKTADAVINIIPNTERYNSKMYEGSTAEESLNKALADLRRTLEGQKTTLEVIEEAQKRNVKVSDDQKTSYDRVKDAAGNVTLVLKDNKDAYIKAGDAAKDANSKVEKYVGTTEDSIKIVPLDTKVIQENKDAYIKASEATKDATSKLGGYEGATKDVIKVVPELNRETKTVSSTMKDVSKDVTDATKDIKKNFSKDQWTLSGVREGLTEAFSSAISKIKDSFKGLFSWLNDNLKIKTDDGDFKLGTVGHSFATGGFPEDGLFFANHNELVGTFSNGKTAVANNAQIVEGIQAGVYNAVSSAMSQQSSPTGYISNEIIVDGEVIARSVSKAQESRNRRYSPSTV